MPGARGFSSWRVISSAFEQAILPLQVHNVLPTEVEFSRRAIGADRLEPRSAAREADGLLETATISPRIAGRYRQLAFPCQHYTGLAAVRQKVRALARRAAPQVRDAFDLHVLWLGGHWPAVDGELGVPAADRERALENLLAMTYADYQGQVLDFIDDDARNEYAAEPQWQRIAETVYRLLEGSEPSGR